MDAQFAAVEHLHGLSPENGSPVPYVECPSCSRTSYTAAAYNTLELCPHCGAGLPLRRRVVSALAAQAKQAGRATQADDKTAKPATA